MKIFSVVAATCTSIPSIPQGSILGQLLVLIYIIYQMECFQTVSFLATILFFFQLSIAFNGKVFQWKIISFDLTKQAQQVIFSRKTNKLLYPTLLFNKELYVSETSRNITRDFAFI